MLSVHSTDIAGSIAYLDNKINRTRFILHWDCQINAFKELTLI